RIAIAAARHPGRSGIDRSDAGRGSAGRGKRVDRSVRALENIPAAKLTVSAKSRKRALKLACLVLILIVTIAICWLAPAFLASDLVMLASVQESRIGDPPDRIDAYVPDGHPDQFYFVAFNSLRVLKGAYSNDTIGIRLHSPALTFGIGNDPPQG